MADNGQSYVSGFDGLYKAMEELSEEIGKGKTDSIWRKALKNSMQPVLESAKQHAPKKSGQLAENIYLAVHRPKQRDKNSSSYQGEMFMARVTSSPIREDTVKSYTMGKRGKIRVKYENKKPVPISQEFGNAKTSAHPYLRISLESNIQTVIKNLGHYLWSEIHWGKYAKKG
jgi:HK97 gp10 family phage protein